jgi:Mlc titration factor MtfA (ptsG expression regulator)
MKRNRNQYRNQIGLPTLTVVLMVCGIGLLAALSIVVNKNRDASLAEQQRQIEQDKKLIQLEIISLERKMDQLLDGARVQPLLQAKSTWLQKIHAEDKPFIYLKPEPQPATMAQAATP